VDRLKGFRPKVDRGGKITQVNRLKVFRLKVFRGLG
jgi:hypothetical protein